MNTVTKIAPAPWGFDGHGINDAEGQRIAKVSACGPYDYSTGRAVRNPDFDTLSNLIAAAPEMLAALEQLLSEMKAGQDSPSLGAMQQVYVAVCKAKGEV